MCAVSPFDSCHKKADVRKTRMVICLVTLARYQQQVQRLPVRRRCLHPHICNATFLHSMRREARTWTEMEQPPLRKPIHTCTPYLDAYPTNPPGPRAGLVSHVDPSVTPPLHTSGLITGRQNDEPSQHQACRGVGGHQGDPHAGRHAVPHGACSEERAAYFVRGHFRTCAFCIQGRRWCSCRRNCTLAGGATYVAGRLQTVVQHAAAAWLSCRWPHQPR